MRTMADLKIEETGIIKELKLSGFQKTRLLDLGFTENSKVKKVMVSPAGDPTAYQIKGTVIALRKEEAKKIILADEYDSN